MRGTVWDPPSRSESPAARPCSGPCSWALWELEVPMRLAARGRPSVCSRGAQSRVLGALLSLACVPPVCSNILFYAVLGGLGAVGLLALLATGRVSPQNLKGLLIALSNAFGLIAGVHSVRSRPLNSQSRSLAPASLAEKSLKLMVTVPMRSGS